MTYRVVMTAEASKELTEATAYIRRDAPMAARRWSAQMRGRIKSLSRNPQRCSMAPESEAFQQPFRELLCGSGNRGTYRVIFQIQDQLVIVLHVRHGSMLPLTPGRG